MHLGLWGFEEEFYLLYYIHYFIIYRYVNVVQCTLWP